MVRRSTDIDLSAHDVKLLETLEQWGWYVIKVAAGDGEPAFAYSMGLYDLGGHFKSGQWGTGQNRPTDVAGTWFF